MDCDPKMRPLNGMERHYKEDTSVLLIMLRFLSVLAFLSLVGGAVQIPPTTASDLGTDTRCEPITVANARQLQPVRQLEMEGFPQVDWVSDSKTFDVATTLN